MSEQASVYSVDALKEFRVAMGMFSEETLGALGAVDMELRRTVLWLQQDRTLYWQDQIKRRREQVAVARAEVARRKLAKTADYTPAYSEQQEILRRAEASLQEAERRAVMVKKWQPVLQQAILEYHASARRIKDMAAGDIPRGMALLERMIDALTAYLREPLPSSIGARSSVESAADRFFQEEKSTAAAVAEPAEAAVAEPAEDREPATTGEPPPDSEPVGGSG
jgi:hypothetical protein